MNHKLSDSSPRAIYISMCILLASSDSEADPLSKQILPVNLLKQSLGVKKNTRVSTNPTDPVSTPRPWSFYQ